LSHSQYVLALVAPGAIIGGLLVYFILNTLLISFRTSLILSVLISALVLGLTSYYARIFPNNKSMKIGIGGEISHEARGRNGERLTSEGHNQKDQTNILPSIIFVIIYAALLIISTIIPELDHAISDRILFIEWQQFTVASFTKLCSAILLTFFLPGYALISIIFSSKQRIGTLPKILLAYILSMFLAGFTGYIMSMMGFASHDIKFALVVLYLAILIVFVQSRLNIFTTKKRLDVKKSNFSFWSYLNFQINKTKLAASLPMMIVFGSLIGLMVFSTSILHGGVIIGDQWYHHGRAIQFVVGNYDSIDASNSDFIYPPLLSALLSSFFILADVPTVNAYASIGFLNLMAVLAFYYFCRKWMPAHKTRSALLAAALFMLGSGFGWVHAVSIFVSDSGNVSQDTATQTILMSSKQTYDIRTPSTFLLASHPDFSTGLQLIVLPIGFLLLGVLKEDTNNRGKKYGYILVLTAAIILGIFSHDEIYYFFIIASILPVIFKLPYKNFIFISLLLAIGIALFAIYFFNEEYLGATAIMGIPLIYNCFFFVIIMWVLHLTKTPQKIFGYIRSHRGFASKLSLHSRGRTRFTLGIIMVLVVSYLYAFTFITWAELPLKDIESQTSESFPRNVPWYLYPMKLGLVGILGIAYLLSYVFRKFETEIFVFGIMAIIAIIAGPYYDEHRFGKYVMSALIGLASLLIYEIILRINNAKFRLNYLLDGMLLSAVIVLSSISTLVFVSYDAWSLEQETGNSDLIWLNRRNFPTSPELDMLEFVRDNNELLIKNISNTSITGIQNVATWPDEYQTRLGLLGKFQGFAGIPIPLMLQSPLVLNASSLESFYSILSSSGTGLIVIPSQDIANGSGILSSDVGNKYKISENGVGVEDIESSRDESSDVAKFAMRNFKRIYQDNNFTILDVPDYISSPSPSGGVAFIHPSFQDDILLQSLTSREENHNNTNSDRITLSYNSQFFDKIGNSALVKVKEDKKGVTLNAYNKSQTLWSSKLEYRNEGPNYIGSEFRVINENQSRPHDECGMLWEEGDKKYYVRIRDDKLEFSETPAPKGRYVIENQQVNLDKWIPYTLQVSFLEDYLKVYVNDILRLNVPSNLYNNSDPISRVGIRCAGNIAEFGPVEISRISTQEASNNSYNTGNLVGEKTNRNYYPISSLALSGIDYDSFLPDDNSVFSKRNIVLISGTSGDSLNDVINSKDQMDRFLNYVRKGGTLTVVNTDKEADGWLARSLLSIKYSNRTSDFDSIVDPSREKYPLKVSGNVSVINSISPDARVKTYYENNNLTVTPFSIEKDYGKGKIVFADAAGYFDAISQSPDKYFSTLADLPKLFGIYNDKLSDDFVAGNSSFSNYYNLGNITIVGDLTINSSSILPPTHERAENDSNKKFKVEDIFITPHPENETRAESSVLRVNNDNNESVSSQYFGNKSIYHDMRISGLDLYGQYKASIKMSGKVSLPSSSYPLSQSDYFGMSIPAGFDLAIQLLDKDAHVNITKVDGTRTTIKYANQSGNTTNEHDVTEIYFHNINPIPSQTNSIDFLIKRPEVSAHGNVSFESLFQGQYDFDVTKGIEGNPLELTDANMEMSLGYVDEYDKSSRNKHTTDYLTYIRTLQFDQPSAGLHKVNLKIPGDISDKAKQDGILVPWKKAMASNANLILLSGLIGSFFLGIFLLRHKRRGSSKFGKHANVNG
jgi:hypothetical protein